MIGSLFATLFRRVLARGPKLLAPGTPAPDFALTDHTGALRRLRDYHGTRVVLWFYPKAATPG